MKRYWDVPEGTTEEAVIRELEIQYSEFCVALCNELQDTSRTKFALIVDGYLAEIELARVLNDNLEEWKYMLYTSFLDRAENFASKYQVEMY